MLHTGDLRCMQAAVDLYDGFALLGQSPRFGIGQAFGAGQFGGDGLVLVDFLEVFGSRDEGDVPIASASGLANLHEFDAIAGLFQCPEIGERLFIGGEPEVVGGLVAEHAFG